ncbi:MAG: iron-containing alcohol dehydrogenase, partial [Alphaproteobacteria bacterium]|nr:iron-containing alcohol dehydrogenase [Alphaproteobacteria bacterium]
NDLCKYAALAKNRPYAIFASAPSMNGYASVTSSLSEGNKKLSLTTKAPDAIFCDLDIAHSAPERLKIAGIGDTLCRSTVQADWLLSYFLLNTPFSEEPFKLASAYEDNLGDIGGIYQALMIGGINMSLCKSSAPASQGEHMIVHAYEKLEKDIPIKKRKPWLHGEGVAIATLAMARIQALMFEKYHTLIPTITLQSAEKISAAITAANPEVTPETQAAILAKFPTSQEQLRKLNIRLGQIWQTARTEIMKNWFSPAEYDALFNRHALPKKPADIGWDTKRYAQAIHLAPYTRERFTFLDLALLTGDLDNYTL